MNNKDSKVIFTGRATDYSKYRPGYPNELFELLKKEYGLNNNLVVAELGAGTGKFSKLLSKYVKNVYAVEPNQDMLNQGVEYCGDGNVNYVLGSAESTNLDDNSVDFVFAVQSFHWFNKENAKCEVKRILKKDGLFAIVWNDWVDENNEFSKVYFDYISKWKVKLTDQKFQHKNVDDRRNFFRNQSYKTHTVIHSRKYSIDDLIGLTKSLSYAPKENEAYYDEFINEAKEIFDKYSVDNYVTFDFHTEMFIGQI